MKGIYVNTKPNKTAVPVPMILPKRLNPKILLRILFSDMILARLSVLRIKLDHIGKITIVKRINLFLNLLNLISYAMKYPNTKLKKVVRVAKTNEFLKAIKVELSRSKLKWLNEIINSPTLTLEFKFEILIKIIARIGTNTKMLNHTIYGLAKTLNSLFTLFDLHHMNFIRVDGKSDRLTELITFIGMNN